MLKRAAKPDGENNLFEPILIILDHFINLMKKERKYFLEILDFFSSYGEKALRPEEIYVLSNSMRLLIFHVSFEDEESKILSNYFVDMGLIEMLLKFLKIESTRIICNTL
jgi:hypothetical protein